MRRISSSESVSEGHPDKVSDQISDAVLDALLTQDSASRVACETLVTTGLVMVAGEVTTDGWVDVPTLVRETLERIGYDDAACGIDGRSCAVLSALDSQSVDIAKGVDTGGAGDQGMMFGFATKETDELMPAPLQLSHRLVQRLAEVRHSGQLPWLRPDGKGQVTLEYDAEGRPERISAVVLSAQHNPGLRQDDIRESLLEEVIFPVLPDHLFDRHDCAFHINPTGEFSIGGPLGDCGLTGRKIIVDTYGGMGRHGGGAFSGKDSTKVDRSGAYAARWAAKNVVAAGLADRCEISLAYAIGVAQPVSVQVDTFGTGTMDDDRLAKAVTDVFDFQPLSIIKALSLRDPIFRPTATYGHFGRTPEDVTVPTETGERTVRLFPWEELDRVDDLKTALSAG